MTLDDLKMFGRFAYGLPKFLRNPLTLEESRRKVARQLSQRGESFLKILERGIFARPRSPYARILSHARIRLEDVAAMVGRNGVEATLEELYEAGVYTTFEEFKGRRPIRRPGLSFTVRPADFDNPLLAAQYELRTGGSRSAGHRIVVDFDLLSHEAAYHFLSLASFGVDGRPVGIWYSVPPVVSGIKHVLRNAKIGRPVEKWFSQNTLVLRRNTLKHLVFAVYAISVGKLMDRSVPVPEHATLKQVSRVALWLAQKKKAGVPAEFHSNPSAGVRICVAAKEKGFDISGTFFRFNGEPYTEAKARIVAGTGGRAAAQYSIAEIGNVGMACATPAAVDDVHVLTDKLAVIQREKRLPQTDSAVKSLYYTTLLPSCPKLMLNTESDDYGNLETRSCGCLFGEMGLHRHLSTIRSYDKVTSEGVTFMGSELVVLVEETLPALFGGNPTDYQFVEEEERGLPKVAIVASPRVGHLDERLVVQAVLEALASGSPSGRAMAERWRDGQTMRLVRREPYATGAAKILPLHLVREY
jgi:hypothetical protein